MIFLPGNQFPNTGTEPAMGNQGADAGRERGGEDREYMRESVRRECQEERGE